MQGLTKIDPQPFRPARTINTQVIPLLLPVAQRGNPSCPFICRVSSHSNTTITTIPLTVKPIRTIMCYGLVVVRAGQSPLRFPDPPDCLQTSYLQPRKPRFSPPFFSISCALFCRSVFDNSFTIKLFRTLGQKHRAWVHPPEFASCFQELTHFYPERSVRGAFPLRTGCEAFDPSGHFPLPFLFSSLQPPATGLCFHSVPASLLLFVVIPCIYVFLRSVPRNLCRSAADVLRFACAKWPARRHASPSAARVFYLSFSTGSSRRGSIFAGSLGQGQRPVSPLRKRI